MSCNNLRIMGSHVGKNEGFVRSQNNMLALVCAHVACKREGCERDQRFFGEYFA